MMPNGSVSCGGGCLPGSKAVLKVAARGKGIGHLCEVCARDDYSLRSFLIALGWVYGWEALHFNYIGAAREGALRLAIMADVDEELSRAEECRQLRLSRRVAWAKGGSGGQWV